MLELFTLESNPIWLTGASRTSQPHNRWVSRATRLPAAACQTKSRSLSPFPKQLPLFLLNDLGQLDFSHPPQLVVFVEYEGGERACRVVDVPAGMGTEAVVVRLR